LILIELLKENVEEISQTTPVNSISN